MKSLRSLRSDSLATLDTPAPILYGGAVTTTEFQLEAIPEPARRDVRAAVGVLSAFPGVCRIWLFGSLAKGRTPDFRSDLDLAVEGLPAEQHLRAWGCLDQVLELTPDLVRWEEANETLRAEINRWGLLLYGPA